MGDGIQDLTASWRAPRTLLILVPLPLPDGGPGCLVWGGARFALAPPGLSNQQPCPSPRVAVAFPSCFLSIVGLLFFQKSLFQKLQRSSRKEQN